MYVSPSPHTGHFLSLEDLRALLRPSLDTLRTVLTWLRKHGVQQCDGVQTGDFLQCEMPVRVPDGWTQTERLSGDESVILTFALKQQNVEKLRDLVGRVSDPDSPQYGHFLSLEDLRALLRPSLDTLRTVLTWLRKHGVQQCDGVQTGDFLQCEMPVRCKTYQKCGKKLICVFTVFLQQSCVKVACGVIKYALTGQEIYTEGYLRSVGGLHRFPPVRKALRRRENKLVGIKEGFHLGVTPSVLRERYNLTSRDTGNHPNNSQACAQFLEQYFSQGDLAEFMKLFGGSFDHRSEVDHVVGQQGAGRAGLEASRHESQEPFLEWMLLLSNMSSIPWVHTISYGDDEDSLSVAYMQRINTEFMKAGARGLTILFAS
ncbi:hypothetical protein AB205_0143850, partial [Aquarana catesbeiana]